jgi:hypothetical protein
MVNIGHQFVKADWNRFKPTNAVNRYQYGLTQYPNASDTTTIVPAIILMYRSTVIALPQYILAAGFHP